MLPKVSQVVPSLPSHTELASVHRENNCSVMRLPMPYHCLPEQDLLCSLRDGFIVHPLNPAKAPFQQLQKMQLHPLAELLSPGLVLDIVPLV